MFKNIILFIILTFTSLVMVSQSNFHLVDINGKTMPLSKIEIDGKIYLSDAIGDLVLNKPSDTSNSKYFICNDSIYVKETFYINQLFFTDHAAKTIVKNISKSKGNNSIQAFAPFSYDSYNKFIIHSSKIHEGEALMSKWLEKFDYELKKTDEDRHIVITESFSTRNYFNPLNENEVVKWSKFSGVDQALFLSLNSQLQTIDVYDKQLRILSAKYVNPFYSQANYGYNYTLGDTIQTETDTWVKVSFYPKRFTRFEALKGFVWISLNKNAVTAMYCEPVYGRRMQNSYSILFELQAERYLPKIISTSVVLDNISTSKLKIIARQTSYITNFKKDPTIIKDQFSDLAMTYRTQIMDSVDRAIPLSKLDSNTYKYFAEDKNLKLNSSLKWGEELYFGEFHTKYFNVNLNELIDYNTYESLRLGYSVSTNESFSDKMTIKNNFAYGFGDRAWKGGIGLKYRLLEEDKLNVEGFVYNDLYEAGVLNKSMVKSFYSTEFLRKFHLFQFNQQQHSGFKLSSKPIKYLNAEIEFDFYKDKAMYSYQFLDGERNKFRDIRMNFRYAFGERYFRFYDENISFKTDYPIVWLNIENNLPSSDYKYTRLQLRMRYTYNFVMNGTSKIELIGGQYFGQIPYFKLFNGLGSSSLKATIHSAFETMAYNEFVSDKYAILFYTHDFGHFNFSQNKTFRPNLEFAFNFGIGNLKNSEIHKNIDLRTFNKGYGEVGLAVKDLLLFYPFGVKIGLGASFYHRLFFYRYPSFKENSIFKITTGFVI